MNEEKIIDGKLLAAQVLDELKEEVLILSKQNIIPTLRIIMVGNNPASRIYIQNKLRRAQEIGINAEVIHLLDNISENKLLNVIENLNQDSSIHGIIVQLPVPAHIDPNNIINKIDPNKDIDGFHPLNLGKLYSGNLNSFIACTPLGCLRILQQIEPDLKGKHAVIIGRSNIVGRPLAALLLQHNLTVTICHSDTQNLAEISNKADIVVCATGRPLFFGLEYFNEKAIVIDVGINKLANGKLVGDVNFAEVIKKVRKITPVPGGVGPMTIAYLLGNTIKAAKVLFIDEK